MINRSIYSTEFRVASIVKIFGEFTFKIVIFFGLSIKLNITLFKCKITIYSSITNIFRKREVGSLIASDTFFDMSMPRTSTFNPTNATATKSSGINIAIILFTRKSWFFRNELRERRIVNEKGKHALYGSSECTSSPATQLLDDFRCSYELVIGSRSTLNFISTYRSLICLFRHYVTRRIDQRAFRWKKYTNLV